ncbi:MAG: pyridoxal phosphate-dependent aminotransferase [Candidatus Nanohaloarchaea archaeon]
MRDAIENIRLSIRKVSEKAAEQENIVRFDIGQPSFDTPEHVKEAAKEGLKHRQGYSPVAGIEELREAVAREESMKKGVEVGKEQVMVATGGMGAIYSVMAAELGPGDQALFNDPCWGPYKLMSGVNGNRFKQERFFDQDGVTPGTREALKQSELVIVNTPQNPTGRMLSKQQAKEFAELADDHGAELVSDEVYHRITFDREHHSPAAYAEDPVIIGSTSKNHAMTGWRIGWAVAGKEKLEQFAKVARGTTAAPPRISQYAAVEALENDSHVEEMRSTYEKRRDVLVERMKELGWDFQRPEGAIYAFPDTGRDSWELVMDMIEEGVAMVPGEPSGPGSDTNVRICFGSSTVEEINRGFDILEEKL